MILFLDFDGVLHPTPHASSGLFCHVYRLDSLLQELPDVRVVISSSWRLTRALDNAIAAFPETLRTRIIGTTPAVPHIFNPPLRYDEIRAWINQNHYGGSWVALDDAQHEFPPGIPQLVFCEAEVGLDDAAVERLRKALSAVC